MTNYRETKDAFFTYDGKISGAEFDPKVLVPAVIGKEVTVNDIFLRTGLSQRQLADLLGWDRQRLRLLLRRSTENLKVKDLRQLTEVLGGSMKITFYIDTDELVLKE